MKPSIPHLCATILFSTTLFCAAEEQPPSPADEARRLAADLAADRKRFASEEAERQKRYQENEAALKKGMADLKSAVRNEVRADTKKNLLLLAVEYVMQTQAAKTATNEAEKMSANNRSEGALRNAASLIAKVEKDGEFSPGEAQHFFEKAAGLDKKSQPNVQISAKLDDAPLYVDYDDQKPPTSVPSSTMDENNIPSDIISKIKSTAQKDWSNDFQMIEYRIKSETKSYLEFIGLKNAGNCNGVYGNDFQAILNKAQADWEGNYGMIVFRIKSESAAFKRLEIRQ